MADRWDVLALGAVAVDDMLYVDHFPAPDEKMPVKRRERRAGGLAGTALVAARRAGAACAYAGTLGGDELSRYILDAFAEEGVSTAPLVRAEGARPYHSSIVIDESTRTRTILFDEQGVVGASEAGPVAEVIRAARALMVDHVGLPGMVRAARVAREAGVPIVADLERIPGPLFHELLGLADHLILPYAFARSIAGGAEGGAAVARALWTPGRAAVIVTKSEEGSWYVTAEEPGRAWHQPAFRVPETDTNGCGDVFHGVYAAALAEGTMGAAARVRFAAAYAALKATRPGGQKGIPPRAEAEQFMVERAAEAPRVPA